MRIATWNVNSLRVRLPHVLSWLAEHMPDVLALQEIKLKDENFPHLELNAAGYRALASGQTAYNGVALLARTPLADPITALPGFVDEQRRVLGATVNGIRIWNLYVPNGQRVGSEKYQYKLAWFEHLHAMLRDEITRYPRLIVTGDFNVAPEDRDVHDPAAWEGKVLCSEPERAAFRILLDLGLVDTFRLFDQPEGSFSWWNYRTRGFRGNRGLRIDHILASPALAERCRRATIDRTPRAWERPSDHAPAVAEFDVD
jgi:exodeoxyribonuclease-3